MGQVHSEINQAGNNNHSNIHNNPTSHLVMSKKLYKTIYTKFSNFVSYLTT